MKTSGNTTGYCRSIWLRPGGDRSCYECANRLITNNRVVQSCMIDTNGLCVDRTNTSDASEIWLAQATRGYCEANDTMCRSCLDAKPKSFTGLCDGLDGCFCTKQCENPNRLEVEYDAGFLSNNFTLLYLIALALVLIAAVWIVCRRRRRAKAARLQGKHAQHCLFTSVADLMVILICGSLAFSVQVGNGYDNASVQVGNGYENAVVPPQNEYTDYSHFTTPGHHSRSEGAVQQFQVYDNSNSSLPSQVQIHLYPMEGAGTSEINGVTHAHAVIVRQPAAPFGGSVV